MIGAVAGGVLPMGLAGHPSGTLASAPVRNSMKPVARRCWLRAKVLSSAEMTAMVHQHPEFASRCAATLTGHSSYWTSKGAAVICGGLGVSPACVASAACWCSLVALAIAVPWRSRAELHRCTPAHQPTCYTGLQQLMACYEGRIIVTTNELHVALNSYGLASGSAPTPVPRPQPPVPLLARGRLTVIYI